MKLWGIALFSFGILLFVVLPLLGQDLVQGNVLVKGQPIVAAWSVVAGAILFTFSLMRSHPH